MLKKYRFGFDVWGLLLFIAVMIPNFIWFAVPAPNDILKAESTTRIADIIASVSQVIFVAAICFLINNECDKMKLSFCIKAVVCCVLLYYTGWVFYYCGIAAPPVILDMTIPPCLVFILFALERKNFIALVPAVIFTVCHIIFGVVNFIL